MNDEEAGTIEHMNGAMQTMRRAFHARDWDTVNDCAKALVLLSTKANQDERTNRELSPDPDNPANKSAG